MSEIVDDINQLRSSSSLSLLPKESIMQNWKSQYDEFWVLSIKRELFIIKLIEMHNIDDIDIELICLFHQKLVQKIQSTAHSVKDFLPLFHA